jgi:hypothetical protein
MSRYVKGGQLYFSNEIALAGFANLVTAGCKRLAGLLLCIEMNQAFIDSQIR